MPKGGECGDRDTRREEGNRKVPREGTYRNIRRVVARIDPPRRPARLVRLGPALDADALQRVPVVPVLDVFRFVPLDEPARPVDRALGRGRQAARPDRHLHARRRRRVLVLPVRLGQSVFALHRAHDAVVDRPDELVGLPVELRHQ